MLIFKKISFWLALLGFIATGMLVMKLRAGLSEPVPPPPVRPTTKPFPKCLGAAGIIEASHENTAVGAPVAGLIVSLQAKVWDKVEAGQVLYVLDSRDLQAARGPQEAQIRVAEATLQKQRDLLARLEAVTDPRAISVEDIKQRRSDVVVAEAQLEAAKASLVQTRSLIERLTVRAPVAGTVLQVNNRVGEYITPSQLTPPVIVGNIDELQVRADIDEQLAPRMKPGARASACIKGDASHPIALEFVRIEPFIIPKKSLTGASIERVDTRVLQVIFRFGGDTARKVYVGQQMDVYIEEQP